MRWLELVTRRERLSVQQHHALCPASVSRGHILLHSNQTPHRQKAVIRPPRIEILASRHLEGASPVGAACNALSM